MSTGSPLRAKRIELGLSQQELADRSGLSVRAVRNLEKNGIATARAASVRRIARALGVQPDALCEPARAAVRVRVLGPLDVSDADGPIPLGAPMQRCLFALLAAQPGIPVSREEIVETLWRGHPPPTWQNVVHTYVGRLRKTVRGGQDHQCIATVGAAYVLTADGLGLDVLDFDRHVATGARLASEGDLVAAADEYATALALWRGPVFADLPESLRTGPVSAAVGARRVRAALAYADIALVIGDHDRAASALRPLVDCEPFHEGLHSRLMLAHAGAGDQGAALALFAGIRARLVDELGVDPGVELQRAHYDVLHQQVRSPRLPPLTVASRQLPPSTPWFTGRSAELSELDAAVTTASAAGGAVVLSAVAGAGGMGKTSLALQWAHDNIDRFPDGQLFVDLRGFDPSGQPVPPAVAVRGFLAALGVEAKNVPASPEAQEALYRSTIADKRVLLVLDNAADSAQVVPLLPGTASCTVLVTSRNRLADVVTRHCARIVHLDVLSEPEARRLLTRRLGTARTAAEPDAVIRLLASCAGLPLALGIVAARAEMRQDMSLAALADELRDTGDRLRGLDAGEPASDLSAVLSWSCAALAPEHLEVFEVLGSVAMPEIGAHAAAALTGRSPASAASALLALERVSLVEQPEPGRFRMHDLVRLYAASRTGEHHRAVRRLIDFYVHTAYAGDRLLDPTRQPIEIGTPPPSCRPQPLDDRAAATAWFDTEHTCLLAAQRAAVELGDHVATWQLAWACDTFHQKRGELHDQLALWNRGLAAARALDDPVVLAVAHRRLGLSHLALAAYAEGLDHLRRSLAFTERNADIAQQAHSHQALAWAYEQLLEFTPALTHAVEALRLYRAVGNNIWIGKALNATGWYHAELGNHHEAELHCAMALELQRREGFRAGEGNALDSLGYIAHLLGDHRTAADHYRRAIEVFREIGHAYSEAGSLDKLGRTLAEAGDTAEARIVWNQALRLYRVQQRSAEEDRLRARLSELTP